MRRCDCRKQTQRGSDAEHSSNQVPMHDPRKKIGIHWKTISMMASDAVNSPTSAMNLLRGITPPSVNGKSPMRSYQRLESIQAAPAISRKSADAACNQNRLPPTHARSTNG